MGSDKVSHFCLFVFLFFFDFSFFSFFCSSSLFFAFLLKDKETTAIYCRDGEFHSDPVCTDPVQPDLNWADFSFLTWVHANGGIINGGVACVCAKWRFLCISARFCVFFFAFLCVFAYQNGLQKKHKFVQNSAKMCAKSAFMQYPL